MIKPVRNVILISLAVLVLQGCSGESGEPSQGERPDGTPSERSADLSVATAVSTEPASRLDGWAGVNNLFRSGRFYFAGQPDEESLVKLIETEGVRTVINIRTPAEESGMGVNERAVADERGARYETIPISPSTFSKADVDRFAEIVGSSEGPILVHCASSNRVGGLWAAYLTAHHNVPIEQALEIGRSVGLSRDSMAEAARRVAAPPDESPASPDSGGG